MKSFKDSAVLITGGSSGIGLGLAIALAERGARVGLIGTSLEKLSHAKQQLEAMNAGAAIATLDVADAKVWPAAVSSIEAEIGPIDSLMLNAGVGIGGSPIEQTPLPTWQWLLNVNLIGVLNGLHACLPAMKSRARAGHVLITSSIAAATLPAGMGPYNVSKAAAVALAETLRAELAGSALGVSVMLPAAVRTEFSSTSQRHAPNETRSAAPDQVFAHIQSITDSGIDPIDVGRFVVRRMQEDAFYIFTHAEFRDVIGARQSELLAAIPGQHLTIE